MNKENQQSILLDQVSDFPHGFYVAVFRYFLAGFFFSFFYFLKKIYIE